MRSCRNAAESDGMPMVVALAAIETSEPRDLLPPMVELRNAKAADQPWLTPLERNHARCADTLPFEPAKPPAVAARSLRAVRPRLLNHRLVIPGVTSVLQQHPSKRLGNQVLSYVGSRAVPKLP